MFSGELQDREYLDLLHKGYLKLKFEIPSSQLKQLDKAYVERKEITFEYRGQEVRTTITSVDVSEDSDTEMVKVFLGFARK